MSWHLAPSLVELQKEINAKWPKRSKKRDGTIGNAAHKATKSDHNPNSRGSVNAIDITYPGVDPDVIISAVKKHPSASYVIFNRKIWSASHKWVPRPYTGASPHTEHLHISIKQGVKAEQSNVKWLSAPKPKPVAKPKPKPKPTTPAKPKPVVVKPPAPAKPKPTKPALPKFPGADKFKVGSKNDAVKVIQIALGRKATGVMTKDDVAGVKKFQRLRPKLWPADGIVGPKTYASLAGNAKVKQFFA